MKGELTRSGDEDRDYDAWLKRLAAQLARGIVETIFQADKSGGEGPTTSGE